MHLGTELLKIFEQKVKEKGCVSVSLHASVTNKPAISLYTKNGFEVYDILVDYYDKNEHGYEMLKRLDQEYTIYKQFDLESFLQSLIYVLFIFVLYYVFKVNFYKLKIKTTVI